VKELEALWNTTNDDLEPGAPAKKGKKKWAE